MFRAPRFRASLRLRPACFEPLETRDLPAVIIVPPSPITEGTPLYANPIATFASTDVKGTLADYKASIDWGDGAKTDSATVTATSTENQFGVVGDHVYAENGSYVVKVTVAGAEGTTAAGSRTTVVGATTPTVVGVDVQATAGVAFEGVVARFRDENLAEKATNFQAVVTWDTGISTTADVRAEGSGNFVVVGNHTYGTPGARTLTIAVAETGGSRLAVTASAIVSDAPPALVADPSFTAALSPGSDTGAVGDGATSVSRPSLLGTAAPLARVRLFVTPSGASAPILIGETVAGADGRWNAAVGPLKDGDYAIQGTQSPSGATPGPLVFLTRLIVDSTPPVVTLVRVRLRTKSIYVTFADQGVGLDPKILTDPSAYTLIGPGVNRRVRPPEAPTLVSVGTYATDPSTVVLNYKGRVRPVSLRITSGFVVDRVGNPLVVGLSRNFSPRGDFVLPLAKAARIV